ncbi:hypothetical protein [Buchananella hordeovulneris]|uniref:Uncharacterized protein n=1 Tax=Buchananella hordeovulneris TaxID=52770 RepID=A0A1Q5PZJ6_9ACTO|nr:hypothetical protein [Buchananella hordeovulneris]MDO5080189.1 hypothetical protein [Buchananella hordeovulneris]OKL52780.1 hypothetical protein BSZ40_01360 [Buchananella hordeovulneris]RRD43878.1 hypothetical protein EII13_06290 [Buchananella hordeovulneris]RRD52219.1 hypothetical protein EII12_05605 [Buchananella hordeovulneris]
MSGPDPAARLRRTWLLLAGAVLLWCALALWQLLAGHTPRALFAGGFAALTALTALGLAPRD